MQISPFVYCLKAPRFSCHKREPTKLIIDTNTHGCVDIPCSKRNQEKKIVANLHGLVLRPTVRRIQRGVVESLLS
jgi:hypothetical protein